MASVVVKVLGGSAQDKTAESVGELKSQLGLTNNSALVNGSPQDDSFLLSDGQIVAFGASVKGGLK